MTQCKSGDSEDWKREILPAPAEIDEVVRTSQNYSLRQPET